MFWKFTTVTVIETIADMTTCYYSTPIATMKPTANGVYVKDPNTEEPDEAKVSRPVREWRRGG